MGIIPIAAPTVIVIAVVIAGLTEGVDSIEVVYQDTEGGEPGEGEEQVEGPGVEAAGEGEQPEKS